MNPCPVCSKKPIHKVIGPQGMVLGACDRCVERFHNLKRVYHELLQQGLDPVAADRLLCEMLNNDQD